MNQEPSICIFENELKECDRATLYTHCSKCIFQLGGHSLGENKYTSNLYSYWSEEDIKRIDQSCNFISYLKKCISKTPFFTNRFVQKIEMNLVRSSDVRYIHSHPGFQVALYYVNMEWEDGWYGETLFYDPYDNDKISFASPYKPGRIILFDGSIPHAIRPQSIKAPKYRFSLSLFFE